MQDDSLRTEQSSQTTKITSQKRKKHGISFNRLIPNLLTMLGLCSGLTGMHFSAEGDFQHAALAILISAFLDGLDGRVARMLGGSTRFGAEFDSLSDFVCFGVAPAFMLYYWALSDGGHYAFLPCLIFVVCMALRLARFNSMLDDEATKPKYTKNFFTGVPAPAGALLVLFPLLIGLEAEKLNIRWLWKVSHISYIVAAILIGVALLLVSTLPIWSFKNFKVHKSYALPIMLGTGICAVILVADPWGTLATCGLLYLSLIPLSLRNFLRLKKASEMSGDLPDNDLDTDFSD